PPSPAISPLSLHDALPIFPSLSRQSLCRPPPKSVPAGFSLVLPIRRRRIARSHPRPTSPCQLPPGRISRQGTCASVPLGGVHCRSEEHTSELQSRVDLVCR